MASGEFLTQGWVEPREISSPTPSYKQHKHKKSEFTKSRFETQDSSGNEDHDFDRHLPKSKLGKKPTQSGTSSRTHTAIDIDRIISERSPRPSATRRGHRSQAKKPFKKQSLEDSSDDDPSVHDQDDLHGINSSETKANARVVSSKKTTSALLLAEETSQILGSQFLQDGSTRNFWNCTTFIQPIQRTLSDWNQWTSLTFYPSRQPVPDSEKVPDDIEQRVPRDEGLFVGEPVQIAQTNWNMLQWRLIQERAMYWFGTDGRLFCFPDPYRPELVQLFREEFVLDKEIRNLIFIPAKLNPLQDFRNDFNSEYELEIDLGYIHFLHHPFFSKEHVVAATLQTVYEYYSQRRLEKVTERSVNKLKALREAVGYTKRAIDEISEEIENERRESKLQSMNETLTQHRERLEGYRNEIRVTSLSRDQGYWDDKASLVAVLDSWKDLKNVRQQQGYTNTSLKLNIIEMQSDPNQDMEMWIEEIEQDLEDIEAENEEIFEKEMAKYRAKMKRWTTKKRTKMRKGSGEESEHSGSSTGISGRPKPPLRHDLGEFKKILEKRYKEIRRRPGEPNIILDLSRTAKITPQNQLPEDSAREQQRRRALKKCKVELHLWLNGNEIYTSKPRDISTDFTTFLGFKIPINFYERPELLELEVVEPETKMRTLKISIPLPDFKATIERCQMRKVMFFSDDVIKTTHCGVGSGVAFEINGKDYEGSFTKGEITFRCGWSVDEDGVINHPKGKDMPQEALVSITYPEKQLSSSTIDPNNPKNARRSHQNVGPSEQSTLNQPQYTVDENLLEAKDEFKLDKGMEEFEFCKMAVIEKSSRYRLLQLRDQGIPEFKNVKMISPYESDINGEVFMAYERRLKDDQRKRMGEKVLPSIGRKKQCEDDFVYESNRLEKIREIRLSVLQLFEKSLKQITFEDLVVEEQIPDIGTLGLNLMSLFQPRRPLRPIRKERKRIQASNLVDTKIDLVFNIVRAFNLPFRKDSDVGLITTESLTGIQLLKKRADRNIGNYSTVRPFVEVWFQRKKVRTTTALGSNPTWNQELQLNLAVPNDDYSQSNLSKMDDLIFLYVYDEVAIDLLEDERRRETDIYHRIERRWLGSISIPFSTLYINGRIEGTFRINMPQVLLGYEPQGMTSQFGGTGTAAKGVIGGPATRAGNSVSLSSQTNAFLTIFITLQPAVQPSMSYKEDNATGESSDMMVYVKNWKNAFERRFPERFVRPFVMTADGDTILCTRYLTAIQPPEEFLLEENDTIHTMEVLAHYVSLFPFVRDSTLGITDYSLWFSSDVFVATPGGGVDDHAVLLACYFLHLNIPSWIVQGNAIPDGPTTFVITSFKGMGEDKGVSKNLKNAVLIWNPCTGEYFNANDNFCPLQRVWSAIGKQNIWANVSEFERPHQIDWNIGKSKSWLALFTRSVTDDKIPCIQTGVKKYKASDQNQANSLAQRIERNLKDAFMKWRSTSKTNWNRYCSATLRRLLPKLEESKSEKSRSQDAPGSGSIESNVTGRSGSVMNINEEHLMELREVMTSYQMSGFPLQQPYVNMHAIMETVFATGVHTIDTPDVEFALAAYAHAYPASVYSVWVYVAALHRRK